MGELTPKNEGFTRVPMEGPPCTTTSDPPGYGRIWPWYGPGITTTSRTFGGGCEGTFGGGAPGKKTYVSPYEWGYNHYKWPRNGFFNHDKWPKNGVVSLVSWVIGVIILHIYGVI